MDSDRADRQVSSKDILDNIISIGSLPEEEVVETMEDILDENEKKIFSAVKSRISKKKGPRFLAMRKSIANSMENLGRKLSKNKKKYAAIDDRRKVSSPGSSISKKGSASPKLSKNSESITQTMKTLSINESKDNTHKVTIENVPEDGELFTLRKPSAFTERNIGEQKIRSRILKTNNPDEEILDFHVKSRLDPIFTERLSKIEKENEQIKSMLNLLMEKLQENTLLIQNKVQTQSNPPSDLSTEIIRQNNGEKHVRHFGTGNTTNNNTKTNTFAASFNTLLNRNSVTENERPCCALLQTNNANDLYLPRSTINNQSDSESEENFHELSNHNLSHQSIQQRPVVNFVKSQGNISYSSLKSALSMVPNFDGSPGPLSIFCASIREITQNFPGIDACILRNLRDKMIGKAHVFKDQLEHFNTVEQFLSYITNISINSYEEDELISYLRSARQKKDEPIYEFGARVQTTLCKLKNIYEADKSKNTVIIEAEKQKAESDALLYFVLGLRGPINSFVNNKDPKTLSEAINIADRYDRAFRINRRPMNTSDTSTDEKKTEPRNNNLKCFYCNKEGHKVDRCFAYLRDQRQNQEQFGHRDSTEPPGNPQFQPQQRGYNNNYRGYNWSGPPGRGRFDGGGGHQRYYRNERDAENKTDAKENTGNLN